MRQLGASVATLLEGGTVLFLSGSIGAGKTTLTQGLLAAAGVEEAVTSPTFSLVEVYDANATDVPGRIWHFDLYRLEQPEELEFIGARDSFNAQDAVIVEWPERGHGFLPAPDIHIVIDFDNEDSDACLDGADLDSECRQDDTRDEATPNDAATVAGEKSLIRMKTRFETSVRMSRVNSALAASPRRVRFSLKNL